MYTLASLCTSGFMDDVQDLIGPDAAAPSVPPLPFLRSRLPISPARKPESAIECITVEISTHCVQLRTASTHRSCTLRGEVCYLQFPCYIALRGAQSIVTSMPVFVCLSAGIRRKPAGKTSPNFYACCLWPLLGPLLTAL